VTKLLCIDTRTGIVNRYVGRAKLNVANVLNWSAPGLHAELDYFRRNGARTHKQVIPPKPPKPPKGAA